MPTKEVVKTPIQMKDGRTVEFTERQKCITSSLDNGGLRFDFKSGDTLEINPEDVRGLAEQFMWHGVAQKYRDEFAAAQDAEDAFEWVLALHERVKKGEWREAREGSGGVSGAGLLVKALMELHQITAEQARAFLADKSRQEQTILRQYGPIAAKIEEIKSRAPRKDTSAEAAALLQRGGLKVVV